MSAALEQLICAHVGAEEPGLALRVFRGDDCVHESIRGLANLEHRVALTSASVLRWGSTTKHVLCSALLLLENRGEVGFEDPIGRYVSPLPAWSNAVSLRYLAQMTSGIPDDFNLALLAGVNTDFLLTRRQRLELVRSCEQLIFAAGAGYSYSNTNYNLLTLVLEQVTGGTLGAFLAAEVFGPLGMSSARMTSTEMEPVPHKADGYIVSAPGEFLRARMAFEITGDGALDSSIEDLGRWYRNYRNDRLFGPDYRARIEKSGVLRGGRETGYGLGMSVGRDQAGRRVVSHGGGMPGYLCDFVYLPDHDVGYVWLSNRFDAQLPELLREIPDLLLTSSGSGTVQRHIAVDDAAELPSGLYVDVRTGWAIEFAREAGRYRWYRQGKGFDVIASPDAEGWYWADERGLAGGFRVLDARGDDGRPHLQVSCRGMESAAYAPANLAELSADAANEFAGRYRCDALGVTYRLQPADSGFDVEIESRFFSLVWRRMRYTLDDVMVSEIPGEPSRTNVSLKFHRDARGRITGCAVLLERVGPVQFRKIADD